MRYVDVHGPVVAGYFYPADAAQLRNTVRSQLDAARSPAIDDRLVGLIVPHAALQYSGPVAATAYRLIEGAPIRDVVAIGPSHFDWFEGVAALPADGWRTPLGVTRLRRGEVKGVFADAAPYRREHCLEVQLPFLHETLDDPELMPMLFGHVDAAQASVAVEALLGDNSLLLVSSDLSHYLTHDEARQVDAVTAQAIVDLRPESLGHHSACGRVPVQTALHIARRRDWRIGLLDLRTSADTVGDPQRVVGYGAFAIVESA